MLNIVAEEPPAKRRRLSHDLPSKPQSGVSSPAIAVSHAENGHLTEAERLYDVGIQEFVCSDFPAFGAVLKKRYTDFLVNEIRPNGEVVHLRDTKVPGSTSTRTQSEPGKIATPVDECHTKAQAIAQPFEELSQARDGSSPALPEVSASDRQRLVEYLNETAVAELLVLYEAIKSNPGRKSGEYPVVRTEFTADRSIRSQIHQSVREIFKSSIDSSTDHDGILVLTAAQRIKAGKQANLRNGPQFKNQRPGKLGWLDRGGEYLHFTLLKENKDTMEVISWLTRQLKCNPKNFQFAGTKDRRAVTVQRCSAYRVEVERLEAQNRTLRGSKVGDFEYRQHGLDLGDLLGNEFIITLREVNIRDAGVGQKNVLRIADEMQERMQSLRDNGYLNYYGLQRFGTFSVRTDVVGRNILQGEFQAACDAILSFSEDAAKAAQQGTDSKIGQDDRNRAFAIQQWRENGRINAALDILPRRFTAEASLIRHLSKHPNDHFGALMNIQRNLRLMYVHAYQSYVWNLAASNRMRIFGNKVVEGDLVLINEHKEKESGVQDDQAVNFDADGEEIVVPAVHDRAAQGDDVFERARALTEAEANSGEYSVFDIVLPLPGYDVIYPENDSGTFYKSFMSSAQGGGLDPHDMRRKQREFSLSGSYRKVVERIGPDFTVQVHNYCKDEEQFVATDLDALSKPEAKPNGLSKEACDKGGDKAQVEAPNAEDPETKFAVVLKFQLGSSQYATMALRELSKDGIVQHKPDFSGGR